MKNIVTIALLSLGLVLSGCGSGSHATGNIDGSWSATLSSSTVNEFTFVTNLTVNADGSLGTSSFNLMLNSTPCDFTTTSESGSFTLSGNFNGQVAGKFHYVITSSGSHVDTLTLDGTVNGGKITGNWSVAGATVNCTGSGTFTMGPLLAGR